MTSQQGQLQALITEIEALLGRAAPKLPWMGSGEVSEQRRVMGQALDYLKDLQTAPGGLTTSLDRAIAPASGADTDSSAAASQQMLQALLQEMQYLRAQMVQPLTSEVIALQQQRETLKNEVRQLEQARQLRATAASQPSPDWVNEVVTQLRSSLMAELAPTLQAWPSASQPDPALSGQAFEPALLTGGESLPQLSPQQRLEQLRQIQSQTDGLLLKLDANLRAVFDSLDQSIQSYCDTLNQGLGAMHGLGQQGEFIFRTFINHLAEQLQDEGSDLAERLASQQALAQLQGDMDDSIEISETAARDELMDTVVNFDDVDLEDLSEFDVEDDWDLEEEVTLFQLDEDFEDWSEAEEDAALADLSDDVESDRGEQTIIQTEPIAWEVATGQTSVNATLDAATDEEPPVAYAEEIDALYDNLFGVPPETDTATPAAIDAVEAMVDEQLRQADTSALAAAANAGAIAEPSLPELPSLPDTSLDFDFLLESVTGAADSMATEPVTAETPPLEALLGTEMAAEFSPDENAGTAPSETIASLTELLSESEQQRQPDPFAPLDETADMFIPASPDENLLDTEREAARPQVDLDLDDDTFGRLSSDLSRLEERTADNTLAAAQLSETAAVNDLFADEIIPAIPEFEPIGLEPESAATDDAPTLDFTASAPDEGGEAAADQPEAAEIASFAALFDQPVQVDATLIDDRDPAEDAIAAPEPTSDATVAPSADSVATDAHGNDLNLPPVPELETIYENQGEDDEDILPRLDLAELELFDEPPLTLQDPSDRTATPAAEEVVGRERSDEHPTPAAMEPPTESEVLSLDSLFEDVPPTALENEASLQLGSDKPQATSVNPEALPVVTPDQSDASFTLENFLGDSESLEDASDSDLGFTLETALGDADEPEDNAPSITLDDVFSDAPEPGPLPSSEPDITVENFFGDRDPSEPFPSVVSPPLDDLTIDDAIISLELPQSVEGPSLTLDDIGFDLEPTPGKDDAAVDDITPVADDASLETWETTLSRDLNAASSNVAAASERLDFGAFATEFAMASEPEVPMATPEKSAPASGEEGWLDDTALILPTLDEASDFSLAATTDTVDWLSADDLTAAADLSTLGADLVADTTAPEPTPDTEDSSSTDAAKTASSPSDEPTPSGLAIATTAEDGWQIVSEDASEALMRAMDTLSESAIAADRPPPPTASPSSSVADSPEPESTISGSMSDGYRLSFATDQAAAAIAQALAEAPELSTDARDLEADNVPASSQLQREYGRQLTPRQGMVAATALPFSTAADLSDLAISDPQVPVSRIPATAVEGETLAAGVPTESALSLLGSVDEGFAIALPDAPSLVDGLLLWLDENTGETNADPTSESTMEKRPDRDTPASTEGAVPLTDEEFATFFPPEATVVDVGSTAERPTTESPPPPDLEALSKDDASRDDAPSGAVNPDQLGYDQPLAALDLSMEEIPPEDIAADVAFQFAFDDDRSEGDRSEGDEYLSDEAIADLDALTTDQEILPTARESAPPTPPAESPVAEPPAAADTMNFTATQDSVFESSGMLATLGDGDPIGDMPDDATDDAPAEAWFLGIDLGTSGLSAVLMEHHSGAAHPLCWVPETAPDARAATFRIPAVATIPTAAFAGDAPFELLSVGQTAATPDQRLLHTLRPLLRAGIPYHDSDEMAMPRVQWSDTETVPLQQILSTVTALLQLVSQPESAELHLTAIGLESAALADILANLQGVVMGLPTNWSDTYCFNMREAVMAAGLVERAEQVFFVEEAIAAILSGLPDPNAPAPTSNRPVQALYQCHWQGGTVVISSGAACTEVGIVDLPQPLDAISREDWQLRNLPYGGDAIDLDIICQLLIPSERRQTLKAGSRRSPNRGWGWQAALPEVAEAHWADLDLDGFDLPRLAEPDVGLRQQLRQHLESSALGQSLLEAARYLKLILQNQNQYQLELADQSWRVLRRDLESRVLVPYIQRINQHINALLSQTGLASQGINQVICTGGNASFGTIAKWLRQKFPNATIIQDTYPSNRPQTCSRVAYGLVNLCRYPQILDVPRHQYSDYFLLHEMMRIIPDAPLPLDGILHLLEEQGINVLACQSRIVAILEGHLPPGLLPDLTTRDLLSRDTRTSRTYQDLAADSLFTQQTRNIYMVNSAQRDRLRDYLALLMQAKQQSLTEPLIAQLVAV